MTTDNVTPMRPPSDPPVEPNVAAALNHLQKARRLALLISCACQSPYPPDQDIIGDFIGAELDFQLSYAEQMLERGKIE